MPDDSWKQRRFIGLRTVLHAVSLSMSARLVYFELDDRSNYKGTCYPKQSTIAACIGISIRAVREGLSDLAMRRFIRVVRGKRGAEYFLAWADRQNLPLRSAEFAGLSPRFLNEQHHEQQSEVRGSVRLKQHDNEPRCILCEDSGVIGSTGADLAFCGCTAGINAKERISA